MAEQTDSSGSLRRWWLARGSNSEGPYSEAYVIASLQGGAITAHTLACPVGGDQWKPLVEWPEFEELAKEPTRLEFPPRRQIPATNTLPFKLGRMLTNPRLPRMAIWICVYCLGINPALMILGLPWAFGGASSAGTASPAFGLLLLWDLIVLFFDTATAIILFVSGLKLKRLRPSSRTWSIVAFYVSLGCDAVSLLGTLFVQAVAATVATQGTAAADDVSVAMALMYLAILVAGVACLVFKIVAVVWLHRHGDTIPIVQPESREDCDAVVLRDEWT